MEFDFGNDRQCEAVLRKHSEHPVVRKAVALHLNRQSVQSWIELLLLAVVVCAVSLLCRRCHALFGVVYGVSCGGGIASLPSRHCSLKIPTLAFCIVDILN